MAPLAPLAPIRPPPRPLLRMPRILMTRLRMAVRTWLLVAVLSAVPAAASTLGTLTAQSVRNEPLRAVLVLPRGAGGDALPSVRLASPAAYERLGFVRNPALAGATVRVVTEPDGQRFARVETDTPIGSAELVLLFESDGGVRRLYRLNLGSAEPADRVNVRGSEPLVRGAVAPRTVEGVSLPISAGANVREAAGQPAALASAAGTAARQDGASTTARQDAAPSAGEAGPARAAETLPTPIAPQARPDAITVAEGADLDALARALRPPGATVEQSAAALWRANRAAFVGRPPRPIAGTLLQVPSEAAVLAIDPAEARAVVSGFAADPVTAPTAAAPTVAAASTAAPSPNPSRAAAVAASSAPPRTAAPPMASTSPMPPRPSAASTASNASSASTALPSPADAPRRDRLVLAAPRPAPARTGRTQADVAFDAELAATLQRLAALEQRLAAVRSGIERSTERELALMRELVDATRRGAPPAPARVTR
jgi:hypothetical protein